MKTPVVTFAISGKLNACVISPTGKDVQDDYIHIVMPLRT
jgi:DNA polymerase III sliding clamp (beta) subunit (PCNA family)